ncbi:unnamed protein product [Phytophthora lilii]|uniref:Unnamed protein product n=1 Tax=Phytophthora lilii TaxID=2077276 RepID=A0A9W6TIW7_9STRA|nr:unnamed protein product [Phytophthora lilii]
MTCNPFESVHNLKIQVCHHEGIPPHQQRLIYQGRQLEDDETLARYGVESTCVLHLVLRLWGGVGIPVSSAFADLSDGSKWPSSNLHAVPRFAKKASILKGNARIGNALHMEQ